jgi:hypothetical protein
VAVSLALVAAAGLVVQTFSRLMQVPLGFNRSDALLVTIRTPTVPGIERNALYRRVVKAVAAVPGVEIAGGSHNPPLAGTPSATSSPRDVSAEIRNWPSRRGSCV